jgi:16S rRNA processing protein RimM
VSDWITVGVIGAPHGVRGEVRVKIETDFPDDRFKQGDDLTMLVDGQPRAMHVEDARSHKGMVLLKLEGVDDRDQAEKLRGREIVIRRAEVKPLPEGTWYIFELEGLEVYDRQGRHLGVLSEVLHPGGNDVYVVKKGRAETLIPALKQVILEVDLKERRMVVDPLEEYEEASPP